MLKNVCYITIKKEDMTILHENLCINSYEFNHEKERKVWFENFIGGDNRCLDGAEFDWERRNISGNSHIYKNGTDE